MRVWQRQWMMPLATTQHRTSTAPIAKKAKELRTEMTYSIRKNLIYSTFRLSWRIRGQRIRSSLPSKKWVFSCRAIRSIQFSSDVRKPDYPTVFLSHILIMWLSSSRSSRIDLQQPFSHIQATSITNEAATESEPTIEMRLSSLLCRSGSQSQRISTTQ